MRLVKVYLYPSGDPRRPYAVGVKTGGMGYRWTFGSEERAAVVARQLRRGEVSPREVN